MTTDSTMPVALTIAGSDSSGGAGVLADLRTLNALGVFGTSAVTCLTTQGPSGVTAVEPAEPEMVAFQVKTICDGFPLAAIKIGMLYSEPIITAIAAVLRDCASAIPLVVDPVMVASAGGRLLEESAVGALCDEILPLATVITPNLAEAGVLCERSVGTIDEMKAAARELCEKHGTACVVTGGHLELSNDVADVLCAEGETTVSSRARIDGPDVHGTGCTFSSAVAAYLAQGESLGDAVKHAGEFTADVVRTAVDKLPGI